MFIPLAGTAFPAAARLDGAAAVQYLLFWKQCLWCLYCLLTCGRRNVSQCSEYVKNAIRPETKAGRMLSPGRGGRRGWMAQRHSISCEETLRVGILRQCKHVQCYSLVWFAACWGSGVSNSYDFNFANKHWRTALRHHFISPPPPHSPSFPMQCSGACGKPAGTAWPCCGCFLAYIHSAFHDTAFAAWQGEQL